MRLVLEAEPDAVPQARRFAAERTRDLPEYRDAAELVVTELVTNAVLHAAGPILLTIHRGSGTVRIEVTDHGTNFALAPRHLPMAMTGRGLGLVAAFASAWGTEPAEGGKTVWVELMPEPDGVAPVATQPPAAAVESSAEPEYEIRIPDVRRDLLLAVRAHTGGVVRDLQLALAAESFEPSTAEVLEGLIEDLTATGAAERDEPARQAATAPGTFTLVLHAPAGAIEVTRRHLDALDEVDRFARSARLLSPPAPPVLRVFRRWLGSSVIAALEAQVHGRPPLPRPAFEDALAEEVTRLAGLSEAAERLSALQRVTGALAHAHSLADIARTMTTEAAAELRALSARVYLRQGSVMRSLAQEGGVPGWVDKYEEFDVSADLPGAEVARTGQALVFRGRAPLAERFPQLATVYPDDRTLHIAPLTVGAECIGLISLTFPLLGVDDSTQDDFVSTLADTLAQALDRALAIERLAEANHALGTANDRLTFLAEASGALSGSLDYRETLDAIASLMVPRLADWCSIQLLDDEGQLQTVALAHPDPGRIAWAREVGERYPTRMDQGFGAANVIRTGRSELYPEMPVELLESSAQDAEHLAIIREFALSSALVVPLTAEGEVLGALTLIYAESGRHYAADDVTFAEDVARRAALALRSAAAFRAQTGRLADVQRVADAAQRAILAPPPERLGPVALAARYVAAAAEAEVGGDFYEVVPGAGGVRLIIGDVRGKGLAAVRTATIVLGEFRAVSPDLDLAEVAARLDRRMRPYLDDEDFVTALLADVHDDGTVALASCGHPPPLRLTAHQVAEIAVPPGLPLGLGGAVPEVAHDRLGPGERLLLYTDGAIEARDSRRRFIELEPIVRAGLELDLPGVLDAIVSGLHRRAGRTRFGDDLALLLVEYCGPTGP